MLQLKPYKLELHLKDISKYYFSFLTYNNSKIIYILFFF